MTFKLVINLVIFFDIAEICSHFYHFYLVVSHALNGKEAFFSEQFMAASHKHLKQHFSAITVISTPYS